MRTKDNTATWGRDKPADWISMTDLLSERRVLAPMSLSATSAGCTTSGATTEEFDRRVGSPPLQSEFPLMLDTPTRGTGMPRHHRNVDLARNSMAISPGNEPLRVEKQCPKDI